MNAEDKPCKAWNNNTYQNWVIPPNKSDRLVEDFYSFDLNVLSFKRNERKKKGKQKKRGKFTEYIS